MDRLEITCEIEREFPFVNRPQGIAISFHKVGCDQCVYLREDLEVYKGKELPEEGITCIHQDMSCLSAQGWSWVFPSYLRYSLKTEASYSDTATEFLIYNLGPKLEHQSETIQRLSGFRDSQISCLRDFLGWLGSQEHWGNYAGDDIDRAIKFLRTLKT